MPLDLVMDPPVHLKKSLSAAFSGKSNNKSKGMSNKSKFGPSKPKAATSMAELAAHVGTSCVVAGLLYSLGLLSGAAASIVGAGVMAAFVVLEQTNPLWRAAVFIRTTTGQEAKRNINVDQWIDNYNELHHKDSDYKAGDDKAGVETRNTSYQTLVNAYYELATLFYEIGWGTSFHFATRRKHEDFTQSIKRHEYYLASKLGGQLDGKKLLDCGCGVGGPYRNIAKFTGADITGVTLNEYQVQRGNKISSDDNLLALCRSVQGDFMDLPFADASFDGAYAIEATCHAPDRVGVYSEIYRVLKPGAYFAMYEWCLTPKYDPSIEEHRVIKKKIEEGDGLPDMARTGEIDDAIAKVGFEVLESRDVALDELPGDIAWYMPLTPSWNIFSQRFQFTKIGKKMTINGLRLLEKIGLAPAGTCKVQQMLLEGGYGCARGGELGIFTPMYMVVVRKPLE